MNGKHDAIEELVAKPAVASIRQVGRNELVAREPRLLEGAGHRRVAIGIAEVPLCANLGIEASTGEVVTSGIGPLAAPAHEPERIGVLGGGQCIQQARALGAAPLPGGGGCVVDVDVGAVREIPHGIEEVEALALHDVVEDVTSGATAKAVPKPRRGGHVKRRALFLMEWTTAPEIVAAARPKDHGLRDELHDVGGLTDPLLVLVGNHRAPRSPASPGRRE